MLPCCQQITHSARVNVHVYEITLVVLYSFQSCLKMCYQRWRGLIVGVGIGGIRGLGGGGRKNVE